jgi:hypothetical protein
VKRAKLGLIFLANPAACRNLDKSRNAAAGQASFAYSERLALNGCCTMGIIQSLTSPNTKERLLL